MEHIPMKNISLQDIIETCSNGKKKDKEILEDFSMINRENIHEIFKYKKFHDDFTDYLTIYKDEENDDILGTIRPCYREFLAKILKDLNIKGERKDDQDLTEDALKQIEKLSDIKTIRELEKEFPELYKKLVSGRLYMMEVEKKRPEEKKILSHYYYSCAMKKSLPGFLKTQAEAYKRYITDRYNYGLKTLEVDYNEYIKEYFDTEKLALYIADRYLSICENTDDLNIIDKYLPTLKKYKESENYNRRVYVKNKDNKELSDYDFEYRMICLQNKVYELRHRKVDWEITKPSPTVKNTTSKPRQLRIPSEQVQRVREIGAAKEKFYHEHTPKLIITGLAGLEGYIAYVYENGEVILDKTSDYPKNAALFNIKVVDFDTLTKLDSKKLKKHPKAIWKPHKEGWQKEIEKIITRKATEEEKEQVKEFTKTH